MLLFLFTYVLLQAHDTIAADSDWKAIAIGLGSFIGGAMATAIVTLYRTKEKDKTEYMQSIKAFQDVLGEMRHNMAENTRVVVTNTSVNSEVKESIKDLTRAINTMIAIRSPELKNLLDPPKT